MHEKFFKIKNIFFLLFLSLINLFGSVKKQYKPFCRDSLKKVTFSDQDFSKEKFSKKVLDPLKVFKREKRNLLLQKCLENIFFSAFKSEAPLGKKQIRYDLLHDWLFLEKIKNDKKKNLFFAKMVAEYCSQKGLREKGYRFLVQYLLRIKKTYGISFADTSNTGKFFSYFSKNKNFKCVVRQFHFFRTNPINMKLLILCFKNQLYRGFSKQSDSMICKIMKKILSPRFDSLSLSLKDGVLICENVYNALYDEMLNKIDCDIAMFENLHLLLVKLIKKMSKKECHDVDLLYTLSSFLLFLYSLYHLLYFLISFLIYLFLQY